jgi:hypothetical protein
MLLREYDIKNYIGDISERPLELAFGDVFYAKDENKTYKYMGNQEYVEIGGGGGSGSLIAGSDISIDGDTINFDPDATPSLTGTALDLNNSVKTILYNEQAPSTSSTFSIGSMKRGAEVVCYIDTAGKGAFPEITNIFGNKQQTQSNDFRTGAIFKMIVLAVTETDIEYYFIDYLKPATPATSLPAPSIINLSPASLQPSLQQTLTIYSDFITNSTTVLLEGQTIDSVTYGFDAYNVPRIDVLVTTGATEDSYDITLNNGSSTVFSNSLDVSIGTSYIPTLANWSSTTGSIDLTETGSVKVSSLGTTGTAIWNQEIDYTKDWCIKWELEQSLLGWQNSSGTNYFLNLIQSSNGNEIVRVWARTYNNDYWQMTTDSVSATGDALLLSTNGGPGQSGSFDSLTSGVQMEIRNVSGTLYFYIDDTLEHTYPETLTQNFKIKAGTAFFNTVNLKYVELP